MGTGPIDFFDLRAAGEESPPMSPARPTLRSLLGLVLVTAPLGCGTETEVVAPTPITITSTQLSGAPLVVHLGEPLVLEAKATDTTGKSPSAEKATWNGSWTAESKAVVAIPSRKATGEEQLALTFRKEGRYEVFLEVAVENEKGKVSAQSRPLVIVAVGGAASELVPLQRGRSLTVGEKRVLSVLALASRGLNEPNVRVPSDESLTWSTSDAAIVEVSASGEATAKSVGSAVLTVKGAQTTTTIPIDVVARAANEGVVTLRRLDGLAGPLLDEKATRVVGLPGVIDDTFALDGQGRPVGLVSIDARADAPATVPAFPSIRVASFSGSGFSLESPLPAWERPRDGHLLLDGAGTTWVTSRSELFADVVVAERSAAGAWSTRRLSQDVPIAKNGGLVAAQFIAPHDDARTAVLPREGGGLWVASWDLLDFRNQRASLYGIGEAQPPAPCGEALHLAEVTHGELKEQLIDIQFFAPPDGTHCRVGALPASTPLLQLLPPLAGAKAPRLLSGYAKSGWSMFSLDGTVWRSKAITRSTALTSLVAFTHAPAAGGEALLFTDATPQSGLPDDLQINGLPGLPAVTTFLASTEGEARGTRAFVFQSGGRAWTGSGFIGPLLRHGPLASSTLDDPSPSWRADATENQWPVRGLTVGEGQLHVLSHDSDGAAVWLERPIPVPEALKESPEASGARFGSGLLTPVVAEAPFSFPDGSRLVRTRTSAAEANANLYRSAGTNRPFEVSIRRDANPVVAEAPHFWLTNGALFAARGSVELSISNDQGRTWTRASGASGTGSLVRDAFVARTGAWFGLLLTGADAGDFQVAFSAQPIASSAPTLSAGFGAADRNRFRIKDGQLFASPTGALLVLRVQQTSDGAERIFVRRFDDSGRSLGDVVQDPALPTGEFVQPQGGGVTRSGQVVLLSLRTAVQIDAVNGSLQRRPLPRPFTADQTPRLVSLRNGDLLLPSAEEIRTGVVHAGWRTTPDGLTYSDFTDLRPQGGDAQTMLAATQEADGQLLFALTDSFGMRAPAKETVAISLFQRAAVP